MMSYFFGDVLGCTSQMLPHKMDQTSGVGVSEDIFVAYVELFSAFQQGKSWQKWWIHGERNVK